MASTFHVVLGAIAAAVLWSLVGYAVTRHLLPRLLAIGTAPVTGWAVHSAVTLPIFILLGFSPGTVATITALFVMIAGASLWSRATADDDAPALRIPIWALIAAAALALIPTSAVMPKFAGNGVHLADPIFDHSKTTIVDAMMRLGLPPVDPVFGGGGAPAHLAYYYLWHYSAAALALLLRLSGWEADVALTWFTAFASLTAMMALAVWLSKRNAAAIFVVLLATATSLRECLSWIFGSFDLTPFLSPPSGFAGWLFQSAWVPQHLMAATCALTAMLLIASYARRQSWALLPALVLIVVAGFESSSYVGGVSFALGALAAAPLLVVAADRKNRLRLAAGLTLAALVAAGLAVPFVRDQFANLAAREAAHPVVVHHFAVLGRLFPPLVRRALDWPAYWLIELPLEFPAAYIAGVMALAVLLRNTTARPEKIALVALACLAGASLAASWLLSSTLGENNDLGLRAVLPAILVLIAAAAAGIVRMPRSPAIIATALGGLVLSLPGTVKMTSADIIGKPTPNASLFAQAPELWAAVRRYAGPDARVANNPLYLQDLTPWPANMSWALLSDRSSCFAGRELALAFAPLPAARREAINAQFIRVFAGHGTPQDVSDMAAKYACDVVVLVPQDGAWESDPFAASPDYRLAENRPGQWRIYVKSPQTN